MPTYYDCGCVYSEDPEGETEYRYEDCEDCRAQSEDDCEAESGTDVDAARRAAASVSDGTAPLVSMYSPNLRREVSTEWEGSEGVQTALYALSLLGNYGEPGSHHVHHGDCTCDGEIVFPRLRLDRQTDAAAFSRSMGAIAALRSQGAAAVSFSCGHHVHVSARDTEGHGLSPNALVSLYSVFAHCEDLLYRLAAAGWSRHRSDGGGSEYSAPIGKVQNGTKRTPKSVGWALGGNRYQGLNVSPYLDALQRCRCGAYRFGEWESCDCDDNRHTVEWRLWNGSVSPRKVRAYIAISAVLTDYAARVPDSRYSDSLTENPYQGCDVVNEDSLSAQLDYLLSRPGFSPRDRDDILWLVSIAPGMGSLSRGFTESRESVSDYAEAVS